MVMSILSALAAIPSILGYIKDFCAQCMIWYVQNADNETMSKIADAAAMSARAKNDEERYAGAAQWQKALSRNRVSVS